MVYNITHNVVVSRYEDILRAIVNNYNFYENTFSIIKTGGDKYINKHLHLHITTSYDIINHLDCTGLILKLRQKLHLSTVPMFDVPVKPCNSKFSDLDFFKQTT